MIARPEIPSEIEEFRDVRWRREGARQVTSALEAERFIEQVGFASCLTDSRRPGPSLYVAVCGRRDAVMPRNVQKDEEASAAWLLKDELVRRANVYYAKLARGRAMFISARMIPHFNAIWGVRRRDEASSLSQNARKILKVLRKEWEMATSDLKADSGVTDRPTFTKALDELQASMLVVPSQVFYQPKFTYIWTLAEARFPAELKTKMKREDAVRELARTYIQMCGMTLLGELSGKVGLPRWEAGKANHELVDEGFAERLDRGIYKLNDDL